MKIYWSTATVTFSYALIALFVQGDTGITEIQVRILFAIFLKTPNESNKLALVDITTFVYICFCHECFKFLTCRKIPKNENDEVPSSTHTLWSFQDLSYPIDCNNCSNNGRSMYPVSFGSKTRNKSLSSLSVQLSCAVIKLALLCILLSDFLVLAWKPWLYTCEGNLWDSWGRLRFCFRAK